MMKKQRSAVRPQGISFGGGEGRGGRAGGGEGRGGKGGGEKSWFLRLCSTFCFVTQK